MRAGNFTSSEIWKLVTNDRTGKDFGKPALTYISEKIMEIRLGRELTKDHNAKPTNWGTFIEQRAFDCMGLEYQLVSKERYFHPEIKHWSGMPDANTPDLVSDIKCPWTLKAFCELVDAIEKGVSVFKAEFPEYYWQLISNAILTKKTRAAIFVYCPYKSELEEIRVMAENYDGDQNKIAFINWASDDELPYLIEGRHYKNLNSFEFDVPQEDIDLLTERVKKAVAMLPESDPLIDVLDQAIDTLSNIS